MKMLVLCTGNACRSQMAEGFLRTLGGNRLTVDSAGITPSRLDRRAVTAMAELGIDISGHTSDAMDRYLQDQFDYVITVCDNARDNCPLFPGQAKRLHWPFDDPAAATGSDQEVMAEFRRVRDEIKAKVVSWLKTIQ
ncbi:MAG: arsenate reductase ArsC [candidate division Zixibacteria bacterium]|nr:arsenate reductase ArsC [candidate division Zixibacteria bacterium]MDH3936160.1 arsenate reductase ArsC [candidate division Zixibacteria bacterium]MDH4032988.1 arsenate reductase ArsC [candidate division Zixibacteria bacterium]